MTQEEKQLLLKDLCARVPYNVKVKYHLSFLGAEAITTRYTEGILTAEKLTDFILYPKGSLESTRISGITPYLRPMSSMTEEEKQEYYDLTHQDEDDIWGKCLFDKMVDYCNKHHLDYRGLIEKGLALEAPEDMYKKEN